jgi:hypothetical protein
MKEKLSEENEIAVGGCWINSLRTYDMPFYTKWIVNKDVILSESRFNLIEIVHEFTNDL